jgi:hypothetical protein
MQRLREVKMSRHRMKSVRFMFLILAGLACAILTLVPPSQAQQKLDAELERATNEYKLNLEHLVILYEGESQRAEEQLTKLRQLLVGGLVTRREVETAEAAAARTRERVAEAQAQLKSADVLIVEALAEAETEESTRQLRPSSVSRALNSLVRKTAYIRYGGAGAWTLSDAADIEQFFSRRFGRALPIGAFGQSALHDRWGYDHRNAMDVGVNPGTNEGQALMEYLRANGIPFTAFHFAVPGKATGPHIHIGLPSHRFGPRLAAANSGNLSGQ